MMALIFWLLLTLSDCPGVGIVHNGIQAFAAGVPEIGPYTDVVSYFMGGLGYIARTCIPG